MIFSLSDNNIHGKLSSFIVYYRCTLVTLKEADLRNKDPQGETRKQNSVLSRTLSNVEINQLILLPPSALGFSVTKMKLTSSESFDLHCSICGW